MAITNQTPEYRGPEILLTHTQKLADDTAKTVKDWDKLGEKVDRVRVGFESLSKQVKRTDEIFTKAARAFGGGQLSSGVAVMKFMTEADKLNRSFNKTFSNVSGQISTISSESQAALRHVHHYGTEMLSFMGKRAERQTDWIKLQNEELMLQENIAEYQRTGNIDLAQRIRTKDDELKKARVILTTIKETADMEAVVAGIGVTFALTLGTAYEHARKMLNTFKDVKLTLRDAMGITERMFGGMLATRGLVNMEKMVEIMKSLRGEGLSYFQDQRLVENIAKIHAATGMSVQALADMSREMRILGGPDNRSMEALGDSMTYFAQQSELGADEVAQIVKSAEPLISDFPRKMQDSTVTSILAVASAFKKVGLNVEGAIKNMEEMQDLTSAEGMRRAGMMSAFGGGNMQAILSGSMSPAQMGMLQMRAQFNAMQQMMRSGLNIQTAASIMSRQGLGTPEDLKKMGRMTPAEERAAEAEIATKEKDAKATDHLNQALARLMGDPIHQFENLLVSIRAMLFGAGARVINVVANMFETIGKLAPVKATITALGDMINAMSGPAMQAAIMIGAQFLVMLPHRLVGVLLDWKMRINDFVRVFAKAGTDMTKFGGTIGNTVKALNEETAAQIRLAEACAVAAGAKTKETLATEGAAVAGGLGGAGAILGGGMKLGGEVAVVEKEIPALMSVVAKAAPKAKAVGGLLAMGSKMIGAGKGLLGKFAGLGSKLPGIGMLIGASFGIGSLISRVQEDKSPWAWIQGMADVIGGILGGLGPIGIIASLAIQGVNGIIDFFRGKDKREQEEAAAKKASEQALNAQPGGAGGISPLTAGGGVGTGGGVYGGAEGTTPSTAGMPTATTATGPGPYVLDVHGEKQATYGLPLQNVPHPSGMAPTAYMNPSGMKVGPSALKFGATGYGVIGGGEIIAKFPTPEAGAAAQFDLLMRKYSGQKVKDLVATWIGRGGGHEGGTEADYQGILASFKAAGVNPDDVVTKEMLSGPLGVKFAKLQAEKEEGYKMGAMPRGGWERAQQMALTGAAPPPAGSVTSVAEANRDMATGDTAAAAAAGAPGGVMDVKWSKRDPKTGQMWGTWTFPNGKQVQVTTGGRGTKGAAKSGLPDYDYTMDDYTGKGPYAGIGRSRKTGVNFLEELIGPEGPGEKKTHEFAVHPQTAGPGGTHGCIGVVDKDGNSILFQDEMVKAYKQYGDKLKVHAHTDLTPTTTSPTSQNTTKQILDQRLQSMRAEEQGITESIRHHREVLAEIKQSNRMDLEKLHSDKREKFIGPSLMDDSAKDLVA